MLSFYFWRPLAGALLLTGFAATAQSLPDLSSTAGYEQACMQTPQLRLAAPLKSPDQRVAQVVCRDTLLVQQAITWGKQAFKRYSEPADPQDKQAGQTMLIEVRKELDYLLSELSATRRLLESIQLGRRKSLRLAPAQWQLDLDGDGQISTWEQYFFAIPQRGQGPFNFNLPSDDPGYYAAQYQLAAVIHVDQSDVLWALAYHQFMEGLLTHVRALEVSPDFRSLTLARPELLKQAHQLIDSGFRTSERMRRSVLAETSDSGEWIANPRQRSSVFPIPLDAQDFVLWGQVLQHLLDLWEGRDLLSTQGRFGGLLAELGPRCPRGQALNIAALYRQPAAAGTELWAAKTGLVTPASSACQTPDAKHRESSLPRLLEQAQKASANMHFLRYLYWTN